MDGTLVRTFLAVAESGQFQEAAAQLGLTQQAVSKRIATLERDLGVRLFVRTPWGARPTLDGQAFLPHARDLVSAEERAVASVRPGSRALRVDVLHRRIAPSVLLREFHRAHPDVDLDVVTLSDRNARSAVDAILAGEIDATFRAMPRRAAGPDQDVETARVLDSRLEVLVGPRHALAGARELTPRDLAGHRIWIPGIVPDTEWSHYYDAFSAAFGLSIDAVGPHFGDDALLEEIAGSRNVATLVGDRDRYLWPARFDLRRIPLREPTPVYPYSLVWRRENPHPAISRVRRYFRSLDRGNGSPTWMPGAATRDGRDGTR
ncbi:LysR family transcriptional regulator [Isoptericola sp. NPDC057391]|uniref:LysR family transcriptional regulator n=1 Tax=Isoptericola sp. NPDC057391 TaxID=3346117 RepID=UPI00362A7049